MNNQFKIKILDLQWIAETGQYFYDILEQGKTNFFFVVRDRKYIFFTFLLSQNLTFADKVSVKENK